VLQPRGKQTSLRPRHGVAIAVGVVAIILVTYGAFSFIVGTIAFLIKLLIVLGLAYLVIRFVTRSARR
jgi:threonine/homoserine/homoserine lactone efflux protein